MSRKFLVPLDMSGLEILNALAQNLATAPPHAQGRFYFDTSLGQLGVSNGTSWVYLGDAGLDQSAVRAIVAGMVDGGTESGISVVYDGGTQKLNFTVNGVSLDATTDSGTRVAMTPAERTKLGGIANGATANDTDANLKNRANHTGTQAASTISNFDTQVRMSRLDQMAAPTSPVALNGQRIAGLGVPTADGDAATKGYVDGLAQGLDTKQSVRAATTANITLSGTQTIDGVAVVAGNRVLVKNQTDATQNGIYVVAAGAWVRATDFDTATKASAGSFVFVEEGASQADSGWVHTTNGTITIGTTALTWAQFSKAGDYTAGNGLTLTGSTFSVKAGAGIAVDGTGVRVDTAVVARKYSATLTTAATSYVITHNLGTRDVQVAVYLNSGNYEEVEVDVERTSTTTVTLRFAVAPAANAYRVVVVG